MKVSSVRPSRTDDSFRNLRNSRTFLIFPLGNFILRYSRYDRDYLHHTQQTVLGRSSVIPLEK